MVATIGRAIFDGREGDDILEDHNAEAVFIGSSGNDRLISRNGRDYLWGGNIFGVTSCLNTNNAATDAMARDCI